MTDSSVPHPRLVRPAPPPLGLYFYAGNNDHLELLHLIAQGEANFFGAVLNAVHARSQRELRDELSRHRLDIILDPQSQQSMCVGAYSDKMGALPWGVGQCHTMQDFVDSKGARLIGALASYAADNGYTQVLSPTHLISGPDDAWLDVDVASTHALRNALDRRGASHIRLGYVLALPYAIFRDRMRRLEIIRKLQGIPAASVSLKIDGIGADCTFSATKAYYEACRDFHKLGLPLIADHLGGCAGLAMLALGAVGGIAHGVTNGERFSSSNWRRPRPKKGFGTGRRIYFAPLNLLLKQRHARALLDHSPYAKAQLGCRDSNCCPRGTRDMLENPGHHFLHQRMSEVAGIASLPRHIRPERFLEDVLKPKTYAALVAANLSLDGEEILSKRLQKNRKQLDKILLGLRKEITSQVNRSYAEVPMRQAASGPNGLESVRAGHLAAVDIER